MVEAKPQLKVFLCHSSSDKIKVREVYRYLQKHGIQPWLDAEDLLPGQDWALEIPQALDDSDAIIVFLSKGSVDKEGFVQKEIKFALDRALEMPEGRIFLIPARLEPCDLPRSLSKYQWVDLYEEGGFEKLLKALKVRGDQLQRMDVEPANVNETPLVLKHSEEDAGTKSPGRISKSRKMDTAILVAIIGVVGTIIAALIGIAPQFLNRPPEMTAASALTNTSSPLIVTNTSPAISSATPAEVINTPSDSSDFLDAYDVPMRYVSEGNFTMGSGSGDVDEVPVHSIYLDGYYIDKYEVTNALYKACVTANVCYQPNSINYYGNSQYADHPVIYVDWNMAKTYCEWRGAKLPTEAQWEKAARSIDERTYPWGEGIDCSKANYLGCSGGTSNVMTYEGGVSPYGVYDMAGNVWEWVSDWYSETYYQVSPRENPLGPSDGELKVVRSGAWNQIASNVRTSFRNAKAPSISDNDIGFRCASGEP